MVTALTVLVVGLTLLESQAVGAGTPWSKFSFRLNFLSGNGEKLTDYGRSALEALKEDIVQACRSGELDEVKGYMGRSDTINIPTKVYYLPHETGNEISHFLLPAVTCQMDPRAQGSIRRSETLSPDRSKPLFLPQSQTLARYQAGTGAWAEFPKRFSVIAKYAFENDGFLSSGGKQALENLKEDMTQACANGELKAVRTSTGEDRGGPLDSVRIPTKVYDFTSTPEPEEIILPAVTCEENLLTGETKIEKPQNRYSGVVQESIGDTRMKQVTNIEAIKEKEDSRTLDLMMSNPKRETWEGTEPNPRPTLVKEPDLLGHTKHEIEPSFDVTSGAESFTQIRVNDPLKSTPKVAIQPAFAKQDNELKRESERRNFQDQLDKIAHESVENTRLNKADELGTVRDKEDITSLSSNFGKDYERSLSGDFRSESRRLDHGGSSVRSTPLGDTGSSSNTRSESPSRNYESASRRLDHVGSNVRSNSWGDTVSTSNTRTESISTDFGSNGRRLDLVSSNVRPNPWDDMGSRSSFDSTPTKINGEEVQSEHYNVNVAASTFIDKFRTKLKEQQETLRQTRGPGK